MSRLDGKYALLFFGEGLELAWAIRSLAAITFPGRTQYQGGITMRTRQPRRPQRTRGRLIRDGRGLPARRVPLQLALRRFGSMLYCVQRSGVFVLTKTGWPDVVLVGIDNPLLPAVFRLAVALGQARQRDPGGVFTLADQVLGSVALANFWMCEKSASLGGVRPIELLDDDENVQQVLDALNRIAQGEFSL
ncbi:MAG TPA: MbcA/ParS/Xre antitoxin family protein [Nevskia sp.]|nr:MbcA/ParS/Xre antitoxin family protein [Nevskia sp.]